MLRWSEIQGRTFNSQWIGKDKNGKVVASVTGGCHDAFFYGKVATPFGIIDHDDNLAQCCRIGEGYAPQSPMPERAWCQEIADELGTDPGALPFETLAYREGLVPEEN